VHHSLDVLSSCFFRTRDSLYRSAGHYAHRHHRRLFRLEIIASRPDLSDRQGFLPSPQIVAIPACFYIAIGILGATVMPHTSTSILPCADAAAMN